MFEAMGFKDADERAEQAARTEYPISVIPEETQQDMTDVGCSVDDSDPAEPVMDLDRDNPEMYVSTSYPSMVHFRLAK